MAAASVDGAMATLDPTGVAAMEATSVDEIPAGTGWQYEPKWDGFRCLAFRDGARVDLRSKAGQPLSRYFPEIVAALLGLQPERFALDGELVIAAGDDLSFDALLQRIHPAESRIRKLAAETPAQLAVFDLLAEDGASLLEHPLADRRARLERFARLYLDGQDAIRLSPATTDLAVARRWFGEAGTDLDGIMAKRTDAPYGAGTRAAMVKVKPVRTADCVIGGFRYAEKERVVGSLLLGLYDEEGRLNHVGFCSGLRAAERPALTKKLEAHVGGPGFTGKAPGGPSRWSSKRAAEWQPLRPELVVEVSFDHVSGGRFRHGTQLLRWRPDKAPQQCTLAQLSQKAAHMLQLLGAPGARDVARSSTAGPRVRKLGTGARRISGGPPAHRHRAASSQNVVQKPRNRRTSKHSRPD